jgi:hypothetical protein
LVIEFQPPGFSNHKLAVRAAGFFRGPQLRIDNAVANKDRTAGKGRDAAYWVQKDDGISTVLKLKWNLIDPVPTLRIGENDYLLAPRLRWYEYVWMGLPIVLTFLGGAIGAVIGILGTKVSAEVFRGNSHPVAKYVITGLVSVSCVIAYLALAVFLRTLLRST